MSHRKDRKEELRQERMERERQAAEAAQRKKLVGYGAAAVLSVAAVAAIVVALAGGGGDDGGAKTPENSAGGPTVEYGDGATIPQAREFDLKKAAKAAGCRLVDPPNEGSTHRPGEDLQYKHNPPTSGDHDPVWTEDGAYTQAPRTENAVHSLEHGRINIQFKPDLQQQRIDQLKALFDEDTYHMLLYPNGTKMPFEVAATTWDHALVCRKFSDGAFDAIRAFKDQYRDQGPEFVP